MLKSMERKEGIENRLAGEEHAPSGLSRPPEWPKGRESPHWRRPDRLLRLPEVLRMIGIGKTTLYAMIKSDEFPRSVKISGRTVGWSEKEIAQWIQNRIEASRINRSPQSGRLAA